MTTSATLQSKVNKTFLNRVKARKFLSIARVMSGELKGFGASVSKVTIDPAGKACTDGKQVWIPEHLHDNELYNRIMQEAVLAHEVAGHHRYTDFVAWNNLVVAPSKTGDCDPMLHQFVNMLEDARINHLLKQDWAGSGKMLDFTHEIFMDNHRQSTNDDSPHSQQAMVAMMTEVIALQPHFSKTQEVIDFMDEVRPMMMNACKQPSTRSVVAQAKRLLATFREHFSEDADSGQDSFKGLSDDDLTEADVERASEAQKEQGHNPEEVRKNRFNDMESQPSQEEKEAAQSEDSDSSDADSDSDAMGDSESDADSDSSDADADGDGESSDANGDGDLDSDAKAESNSDSDAMEGDAEDGMDMDTDGEIEINRDTTDTNNDDANFDGEFEENWAELLTQVADDTTQDYYDAITSEKDFQEEVEQSINSIPNVVNESPDGEHRLQVTAGTREFLRDVDSATVYTNRYNQVVKDSKTSVKLIKKQIMNQIKGSDPRWNNSQRTGRLNQKQVYKVLSDASDSRYVFKKKNNPSEPSGNAIILIDASGSMGGSYDGSRASEAAKAAVVFSEVFASVGFSYEVIDFSTMGNSTTLRVRKGMGSNPLTNLEKAAIAMPSSGGCNADGYAVEWCINKLNKLGDNRMLVVISDGAPSDGPSNMSASEHLISVVQSADKDFACLGIGIDGHSVAEYYPNSVTSRNVRTIGKESLPTMKRMLKKMLPKGGQ